MNTDEFLELVARHQADIRASLTADEYTLFLARVRALSLAGDDEVETRKAVIRLGRALLPLPVDSPVRRAVTDGYRLSAGTVSRLPEHAGELLRLLEAAMAGPAETGGPETGAPETGAPETGAPEPGPPETAGPSEPAGPPEPDPPGGPEAILAAVHRRLLAAPARTAAELDPRLAEDPAASGLIRLPDPVRGPRYPAFQFDPADGLPRPVVLRINRLLLADQDPWGAADWWLGGNTWLAGTPAALLGQVPDTLLTEAALALVEGD